MPSPTPTTYSFYFGGFISSGGVAYLSIGSSYSLTDGNAGSLEIVNGPSLVGATLNFVDQRFGFTMGSGVLNGVGPNGGQLIAVSVTSTTTTNLVPTAIQLGSWALVATLPSTDVVKLTSGGLNIS